MIVVSYYTDRYKKHADALAAALANRGILRDFDHIRDYGSWKETTALKPAFLRRKLDEHKDDDAILWIDADAMVHRDLELFGTLKAFDLAVYRHLETTAYHSREWHNFGQVWNGTLWLRICPYVIKIVDAWILEQAEHPDRLEQKNLAAVLARSDPSRLYCLPPEYCWVEEHMRARSPNARPVVEHYMVGDHGHRKARTRKSKAHKPSGPECLWSGHAYDYSGYAKANREVLLRVSNTIRVQLSQEGLSKEPALVDDYTRARLDVHVRTAVGDRAPLVRFYTPQPENHLSNRYRICWTMMETHPKVHPYFVYLLNENYHEVWTPTGWGANALRDSGLRVPCVVMPLGVNPAIFRSAKKGEAAPFPKARRLTGKEVVERPRGRIYLTVCQPTFRKGLDVLVRAWDAAGVDGSLVIYTGIHENLNAYWAQPWRWVDPKKTKSRIYQLTGRRTEFDMARIYWAADVYITATRGEGFDLPLLEASACGLPVIAPDHTAHGDSLVNPKSSILVEPDGYQPVGVARRVSEWYDGQSFAWYGKRAVARFAEAIRKIPHGKFPFVFSPNSSYDWSTVASTVVKFLLERQP